MATLTTYTFTAAGTGDTYNDGSCSGVHASDYVTARATCTTSSYVNATAIIGQRKPIGQSFAVRRYVCAFNTSTLPSRLAIVSVRLSLTATVVPTPSCVLRVVRYIWTPGSSPDQTTYAGVLSAATTALEPGAFSDCNTWLTGTAYSSGLLAESWVSRTGYTFYGVLSEKDRLATDPTGTTQDVTIATASHATSTYRPYLTVIGYVPPKPRRRVGRPQQIGFRGH